VAAGEIVGISGPNGAGKSTLLKAIAGIQPCSGAQLRWNLGDGREPVTRSPGARTMVRHGIALVPEGRNLFSGLSVEENLRLGSVVSGTGGAAELLAQVYDIFPKLGQRRRQDVNTLSGGERQMVAIGRGLMTRPRLMLVDELSLGLAPVIAADVYEALLRLNDTLGLALVLVDESLIRLNKAVRRLYFMRHGVLSAEIPADKRQGSMDELFFADAED
jgi:branched-chain amino acid transport system ATP-binding protein